MNSREKQFRTALKKIFLMPDENQAAEELQKLINEGLPADFPFLLENQNFTYPLHIAIQKNKPLLCKILLKNGASPFKLDYSNKSPHTIAREKNYTAIEKIIKQQIALPSGQSWLLLGLKLLDDDTSLKGVCFGVASKGIRAILKNEVFEFRDRYKDLFLALYEAVNLLNIDPEILINSKKLKLFIESNDYVKLKKAINAESPNPRLQKIFKTMHKILHYQNPKKFKKFNKGDYLIHNALFEMNPASEEEVYTNKIKTIASLGDIYNENKLKQFLRLIEMCMRQKPGMPFAIELLNADHTITIGKNSETPNWIMVNSNTLEEIEFTAEQLPQMILKCFENDKWSAFAAKIFCSAENFNDLAPIGKKIQMNLKLLGMNAESALAADEQGNTALIMAARVGDYEKVQLLLNYGADINACYEGKHTPLFLAVANGHAAVVELLLKHNAPLTNSIINTAIYYRRDKILEVFASHLSVEQCHELMKHAIRYDKKNVLNFLLHTNLDHDYISLMRHADVYNSKLRDHIYATGMKLPNNTNRKLTTQFGTLFQQADNTSESAPPQKPSHPVNKK